MWTSALILLSYRHKEGNIEKQGKITKEERKTFMLFLFKPVTQPTVRYSFRHLTNIYEKSFLHRR
jgi:hypothetical protein